MNKTVYEQALEEGIEEGQIALVEKSLSKRFGSLSPQVREHLAQMSSDDLSDLVLKIGTAANLTELGLPESPAN